MRILSLIFLSFFLFSFKGPVPKQKKPNIIFILSDDHAYQTMGIYGNKLAKTPNIDRLAQSGAIFKNTFITNSICGPSRAILLTGKYSHINGYKLNEKKFDASQDVFPELLQKNGYHTAWVGKLHLGAVPKGLDYWNILPGHGYYYNPEFINTQYDTTKYSGYVTDLITDFAVDWMNQQKKDEPFFLVVGHKATHREWFPAIEDLGAYDHVNFPLPANFYDNYSGRVAAQQQDMSIEKTMRLKEDLKVGVDFFYDAATVAKMRQDMIDSWLKGATPTAAQEKLMRSWISENMYTRLSPEQREPVEKYYKGILKEFDDLNVSGNALTEWKYQRYMRDYLSTANSLDRNIGRVLDYLDKNGLAENTIVMYASDQGFYMGEHGWFDKRFIYEESLRTAFMLKYPQVVKPGTVVHNMAIGQDWSATILDAAGVKVPENIQGESLLPLVRGEKVPWRKEVYYHYYEFPEPHHVYPHFGIRNERYKLVRFYGGIENWELYDLKKDPTEMNNIYNKKENSRLVKNLKISLKKLMIEYKDEEALKISKL